MGARARVKSHNNNINPILIPPDTPSAAELKDDPASAVLGVKESVGNKVSNATKGAVNKVKDLFKKKK